MRNSQPRQKPLRPRTPCVGVTSRMPRYVDNAGNGGHGVLAESDALYADLATRADRSRGPVFINRLSCNTLENVMFVADFIRDLGAPVVSFLSNSYAVGRSAMTIRAVLPGLAVGGCAGLSLLVDGKQRRQTPGMAAKPCAISSGGVRWYCYLRTKVRHRPEP